MASPADTVSSGGGAPSPARRGNLAPASASASEKSAAATTIAPASAPAPSNASPPALKLRSCVTCRQRKVRCDKLSPCSNCRRAEIVCIFPSADRPPRWARRLRNLPPPGGGAARPVSAAASAAISPAAGGQVPGLVGGSGAGGGGVEVVVERIRNLEKLVRELKGGIAGQHQGVDPSEVGNYDGGLPRVDSDGQFVRPDGRDVHARAYENPDTGIPQQFGRLVIDDSSRSRYVSSGFWSRVNDELDELRRETQTMALDEASDDSEDWQEQSPPNQEFDRPPAERHAFLFGHNLQPGQPDLKSFRPLPSQIQFLFQAFQDNINIIVQLVFVPTVTKLVRGLVKSNPEELTPSNEALMFSIYYAAVASMEEEDVETNFRSSKAELIRQFRLGLELALAKADFLNVPDFTLLQAFLIFLCLCRRHDSPRFVWMMTGLAIRMAQALGLQRDGSNFKELSPWETEMRRRLWWCLCAMDVRASEDQGTDLTIVTGSFDTKLPLNINDADIDEDTEMSPTPREGWTDMTCSVVNFETQLMVRRMMAPAPNEAVPTVEQKTHMLDELEEKMERLYLRHSEDIDVVIYWVGVTVLRLVVAKMTLILYLPTVFFARSQDASAEIRAKLFTAALEVAEYNHMLNSEPRCRHWRWVFQTYTQWHAIAILVMECARRPWGPAAERAWVALHSRWLIPAQSGMGARSLRAWLPIRRLMAQARRHRAAEADRLRRDPPAARRLEQDDEALAPGQRFAPLTNVESAPMFRDRWRKLVGLDGGAGRENVSATVHSRSPASSASSAAPSVGLPLGLPLGSAGGGFGMQMPPGAGASPSGAASGSGPSLSTPSPFGEAGLTTGQLYPNFATSQAPMLHPQQAPQRQTEMGLGLGQFGSYSPWLWADTDPAADVFGDVGLGDVDVDMDMGGDINWQTWFESVRELGADQGAMPTGQDW